MVEIRSGDRAAAFQVPFEAYGPQSPYVSPMWSDFDRQLDPTRNPLMRDGHGRFELFTAHVEGRPVGRVVACIHDASNTRHGTAYGQFGYFDCVDDPSVATSLLETAENWVRQRGAKEIAGNFNLTAMQMIGVMTDGFEHVPYTDQMWSPPHIATHLERCGYAPTFPMNTFETDLRQSDPEALLGNRQREVLTDPDFTWHPVTRRTFKARMNDARVTLNDGFADNPMFVPLTEAEFTFQSGEMMWVMDPRLSMVVHYKGRPAGVVVCIPDLNPFVRVTGSRLSLMTPLHYLRFRMNRTRAVVIYYSVAQNLHKRGINGAMLYRLTRQAQTAGYTHLGGTWISDGNAASLAQFKRNDVRHLHRLHMFHKSLEVAS